MAPIRCLRIISYSSQDSSHKVENVINPQNLKKWLCEKDAVGGNLEVEIALESSSKIEHINIGNHGSSYVEILVGRSLWQKERKFEVLLPSVSLMTPLECKEWRNMSKVFMFSLANFRGHIAAQKWDRIKVKCRQPLAKDKQFGLGFIELRAPDLRSKVTDSASSEGREFALEKGGSAFKKMVNKAIHSSGGSEFSSGKLLSRSARVLQTALLKQSKNGLKSPVISRVPDLLRTPPAKLANDDSEYGQSKDVAYPKTISRLAGKANTPVNNRRSSKGNAVSAKFDIEVKDFLKEFNLNAMKTKNIQVSDVRQRMERMRGSRLNNAEKQVFFKLIGDSMVAKTSLAKDDQLLDISLKSHSKNQVSERRGKDMTGKTPSDLRKDSNADFETPSGLKASSSKTPLKRRNAIACRNVLCYDDDIDGPPRKMAINQPLDFSKDKENDEIKGGEGKAETKSFCPVCGDQFSQVILEIHASYCQGKSILEFDSQPTEDSSDGELLLTQSSHCPDATEDTVAVIAPKHGPASLTKDTDQKHAGKSIVYNGGMKTTNDHTKVQARSVATVSKMNPTPPSIASTGANISQIPHATGRKATDRTGQNAALNFLNEPDFSSPTCFHAAMRQSGTRDISRGLDTNLSVKEGGRGTCVDNVVHGSPNRSSVSTADTNVDIEITKFTPGVEQIACPICTQKFSAHYITYHANMCADFRL